MSTSDCKACEGMIAKLTFGECGKQSDYENDSRIDDEHIACDVAPCQ